MVKQNFFTRLGIVQLVRGWLRRRRFIDALNKCDALNRQGKKHIVVCLAGEPFVISKTEFKERKRAGVFIYTATWGQLCRWRVTRDNLDSFFNSNPAK